jgi:hypothetical protein
VIAGALLLLVVRSFQNPAPAFAQTKSGQSTQAVQRVIQHVIVDNMSSDIPQHVIVDEVGVDILRNGVPVSLKGNDDVIGRSQALPMHVIVDDIATRLTLSGLPVSLNGFGPQVSLSGLPVSLKSGANFNGLAVRWRYEVSSCGINEINRMAQGGWELSWLLYSSVDQQRNPTDALKACTAFFRQPM